MTIDHVARPGIPRLGNLDRHGCRLHRVACAHSIARTDLAILQGDRVCEPYGCTNTISPQNHMLYPAAEFLNPARIARSPSIARLYETERTGRVLKACTSRVAISQAAADVTLRAEPSFGTHSLVEAPARASLGSL